MNGKEGEGEEQAIGVAGEQVAGYQGRRTTGNKGIGANFVSREREEIAYSV